jgi:hypothetical protein
MTSQFTLFSIFMNTKIVFEYLWQVSSFLLQEKHSHCQGGLLGIIMLCKSNSCFGTYDI